MVALAAAAPQVKLDDVQILRFDTDNDGVGNWEFK